MLVLFWVLFAVFIFWLSGVGSENAPPARAPTEEEMDELTGNEWIFDE